MERGHPVAEHGWTRTYDRRSVLKLGAAIAAGAAVTPLLAACATPNGSSALSGSSTAADPMAGPITLITIGGDPSSLPPLQQVYDGFRALHPGVEWDIRAIPGGGPEWDRLARTTITSGEPVGLLMINGQQLRGWVRDGLLADLGAIPELADVLARVPERFHLGGAGEETARAFPLASTFGVHTTGLFYNRALLDQAGLEAPRTFEDLRASVGPLAALGAAPLVHCSGDVIFNQMLITWILPMVVERTDDPIAFAERTVRGEVGYDSPEWLEALRIIADLRTTGVLLAGSGAVGYAAMQQLVLQGKAAMTYNGSWLLPELTAASPSVAFDLHVAPPPVIEGATRARPILAWSGFAMPAQAARSRETVYAFLEYASRPEIDQAVVAGLQVYSPIAESNVAIEDPLAQEFLPMFEDAITPMDWLWEPEITAELDSQVQALVNGDTDPASVGRAVQAVADGLRASGRSYYP
jgi:raffinose/stachyose/melibiose transport system substrate-binding protein